MVTEYANYLKFKGHDVTILTNIVDTVFDIQAKVENISRGKSKLSTIIHALFFNKKSDLIIADIIIMTLLLSFRNRKNLLYFAQDYDESYYKSSIMKLFIRLIYYICLNFLKIPTIAVSEKLGTLLKQRFSANVKVINNGVDTNLFYPDKDEVYLSLKGKSKVILIFSRSDFRKGFDLAIRVLEKFKNRIDAGEISVWSVGEHIPVSFPLKYFGFVTPEILRKLLSCSDIFFYPSRHEGLPLFILEAMSCGCPVVTTEASNIVKDGFNGLVCPVEDTECLEEKIKSIFSNKELANILIKNSKDTVSKFDLNNSKYLFENTLIQLINGQNRSC